MKPVGLLIPPLPSPGRLPGSHRHIVTCEECGQKVEIRQGEKPNLPSDAVPLERERVLHRALDEVYFRVPLAAGRVVLTPGVVPVTEPVNGNVTVLRYPALFQAVAERQEPRRDLWVGTAPKVTVWYTSPVGGTANFSFLFVVRAFGLGVTTTVASLSVTWTAPGPAVANTVLQTQARITSGKLWASPAGSIDIRLARQAPDANANDLDVLFALVSFEEVA